MISPRRIFRTVDGKLVAEGHPEAAFLVAGAGCLVPDQYKAAAAKFADSPDDEKPSPEPTAKVVDPEHESKRRGRKSTAD